MYNKNMLWEVIEKNKRKSILVLIVMAAGYIVFYSLLYFFITAGFVIFPFILKYTNGDSYRLLFILGFPIAVCVFYVLKHFISSFISLSNKPYKMNDSLLYKIKKKTNQELYNIAEETALASGISRMPSVYVLDSKILNAYACGIKPEKSSIVISKGLLEILSREELQCIFAHELSHIVNRDTMYLLCAGILFYNSSILSRDAAVSTDFYDNNKKDTQRLFNPAAAAASISVMSCIAAAAVLSAFFTGELAWIPFAVLLAVIYLIRIYPSKMLRIRCVLSIINLSGYIVSVLNLPGLILCRILFKFISKKREYLADACAVLYTRNPAALASAMRKIEEASKNSIFENEAEKANPLIKASFFAHVKGDNTHPDTENRIKILEALKSADLNEYEKEYKRLTGKTLLPKSALERAEVSASYNSRSGINFRDAKTLKTISPALSKGEGEQLNPVCSRVQGDSFIVSACSLNKAAADADIQTLKENKELLKENIKKHRHIEDMVRDLAEYTIINCECGTKLKIPPVYKNQLIICPHCGKKHILI